MRKFIFFMLFYIILITLISCNAPDTDIVSSSKEAADEKNIVFSSADTYVEYFVIRGDYTDATDVDSAVKLRKKLETYLNMKIGITTDWEKNPVYEYEFIVGNTLREKTENVKIDRKELGETGFVVKAVNNKIYMAGGASRGTAMAVDYFIDNFMNSDGIIEVPKDFYYVQYHQYDIPQFYIGNTLIDNTYVIQCMNQNDNRSAEYIQSMIYYKTGVWLDIIIGGELNGRKPAVILSNQKPGVNGVYKVSVENSALIFSSSASDGIRSCVDSFIITYINDVYGAYKFDDDFIYIDLGDYIIVNMPETRG